MTGEKVGKTQKEVNMAYYTDLMEMKNDTARKNAIRERVATVIEKAMIEEFGAENVRRMKNTIAAAVGEVTNKAGQTMDACVEIAPKCCSWDYVVKKNGDEIEEYNLDAAYEAYNENITIKQREREQRKAEREAKKKEK